MEEKGRSLSLDRGSRPRQSGERGGRGRAQGEIGSDVGGGAKVSWLKTTYSCE